MDFAKGLLKAYETKWSFINTFKVQIQWAPDIAGFIGWNGKADEENINLNIISIDTPQLSNSNIESYVGDKWRLHNGRDEVYRFSITFRDQDQLKYYKMFSTAYLFQKARYFNDVKMIITLFKEGDYFDEGDVQIYDFHDVMIDSVSQVQFNNTTEAQIAEFTVQFKCATPLLNIKPTKTGR